MWYLSLYNFLLYFVDWEVMVVDLVVDSVVDPVEFLVEVLVHTGRHYERVKYIISHNNNISF